MARLTATLLAISLLVLNVKADFAKQMFAKYIQHKEVVPGKLEQRLSSVIGFEIPREDKDEIVKKKKPGFCNDLDCPDFDVVSSTDDYEEREYVKTEWVSTSMLGVDFKDAQYQMFRKLFGYIQGNNDAERKIDMTAPVITSIIPGQGPACESNFTMSFFMSPSVTDPPAPKDNTVFLNFLPGQNVYVRSFAGFAKENDWLMEAKQLGDALEKDGKTFDGSFFYSAGYNSPFQILNRHNEVWFLKK